MIPDIRFSRFFAAENAKSYKRSCYQSMSGQTVVRLYRLSAAENAESFKQSCCQEISGQAVYPNRDTYRRTKQLSRQK